MKKNKIVAGIIGRNFGYKVLYKALLRTKKFNIKAISFKSKKKKKITMDLTFLSDWKKIILDKKIKAIIIASPPNTHKKIISLAIKHNKHIFCEKPCTISFSNIVDLINQINNKKNFISHAVNYEMLNIEAFKKLKSIIIKKKNQPLFIKINWNILNRTDINNWKNFHNKGGGLVFNYYCHTLYYLNKLFGNIKILKIYKKFNIFKHNRTFKVKLVLNNKIPCLINIKSSKKLSLNDLYHKIIVKTKTSDYVLSSKTKTIYDNFSLLKISKRKKIRNIYRKIIKEDFRITPSQKNLTKFALSIKRKKTMSPNFNDAKSIHLLINKSIENSIFKK